MNKYKIGDTVRCKLCKNASMHHMEGRVGKIIEVDDDSFMAKLLGKTMYKVEGATHTSKNHPCSWSETDLELVEAGDGRDAAEETESPKDEVKRVQEENKKAHPFKIGDRVRTGSATNPNMLHLQNIVGTITNIDDTPLLLLMCGGPLYCVSGADINSEGEQCYWHGKDLEYLGDKPVEFKTIESNKELDDELAATLKKFGVTS